MFLAYSVFGILFAAHFAGCKANRTTDSAEREKVKLVVESYIEGVVDGDRETILSIMKKMGGANAPTTKEDLAHLDAAIAETKANYGKKHRGLNKIELKVIEIDDNFAQVLAAIEFQDGYLISLGVDHSDEGWFANIMLPETYSLTRDQDQWKLSFDDNDNSAMNRAQEFINALLEGNGGYNSTVCAEHSSPKQLQLLANVTQAIRDLKTSIDDVNGVVSKLYPGLGKGLNEVERRFDYGASLKNVEPSTDKIVFEFSVSPGKLSCDIGSVNSVIISMRKLDDKWSVALDDSLGLLEVQSLLAQGRQKMVAKSRSLRARMASTQAVTSTQNKPSSIKRPSSPDELKSFAKSIANATGRSIMEEIGGGQDLVVNVTRVDYDRSIDEYEVDISVSFNGAVFRADNYQVAGRITVSGDGSNARFARTLANEKYKEWEGTIRAVKITAAILEAANKNSK